MTAEELQFAALQGVIARRALTAKVSDCPYGRPSSGRSAGDNVKAVLWRWGFKGALSKPPATVSRGADPRGLQWTKVQLQVLRHCRNVYRDGEIAAMIGRSHQAVRNRLSRMRREEGALQL